MVCNNKNNNKPLIFYYHWVALYIGVRTFNIHLNLVSIFFLLNKRKYKNKTQKLKLMEI